MGSSRPGDVPGNRTTATIPGSQNATNPAIGIAVETYVDNGVPTYVNVYNFFVAWEDPTVGIKYQFGKVLATNAPNAPPSATSVTWLSLPLVIAANQGSATNSKPTIAVDRSNYGTVAWQYWDGSTQGNIKVRRVFKDATVSDPYALPNKAGTSHKPLSPTITDYRYSLNRSQTDLTVVWHNPAQGVLAAQYSSGSWGNPYIINAGGQDASIEFTMALPPENDANRYVVFTGAIGPPFAIQSMLIPLQTVSAQLLNGWNLASVPVNVGNPATSTVWPTATSVLQLTPSGWVIPTTLATGVGCYVKFPSDQTISYAGTPITQETIPVVAGWNMIGSISRWLNLKNILPNPSGIISSAVYGYNHGFSWAQTIDPGQGYWIGISLPSGVSNGTLTLSADVWNPSSIPFTQDVYPSSFSTIGSPVLSSPSNGATNVSTYPTLCWNGVSGASSYHLQVSQDMGFTSPAFDQWGITSTYQSVPLSCGTRYYWHVNSEDGEGAGSWSIPSYYFTTVSCPSGGGCYSASNITGKAARLPNAGKEKTQASVIKQFRFEAYPNPFNPITEFSYDLPAAGIVRFAVYDVLGRRLTSITNGEQPSGTYQVQWDGSRYSSGIYFARFEVVSEKGMTLYSKVEKVLLEK